MTRHQLRGLGGISGHTGSFSPPGRGGVRARWGRLRGILRNTLASHLNPGNTGRGKAPKRIRRSQAQCISAVAHERLNMGKGRVWEFTAPSNTRQR